MKGHMLTVDRQIEEKHRDGEREPSRQRKDVEQAPSLGLGEEGHPDGCNRKQQTHDKSVDHHKTQVIRPAEKTFDGLRPARRQQLPNCHQYQHAQEAAQPNDRLSRDRRVRHARLPATGLTGPAAFIQFIN